jgi:selenocysteine-specific elongation factor
VRSFIIGTAGHIDHGKSALVRALTGTDPDRLKEEKERGITIDLGFAHAPLSEDVVASFIDVPGHERFVRNMLAGAHGIDAVLLVVAADESVMPQTREHFHISRLLGIRRGLIALTKCDVADPDSQTIAEMETRELVAGSFLEGCPIVRCSAKTGEGLAALRGELLDLAGATPERETEGLFRLPVDRSFVLHGFGTVVTGTLVGGSVAIGDEVELLPSGRRARVRGLQVHGATVDRVGAGNRAAVNLAGVDADDVQRGDVVVRPGTLRATSMLDLALDLLPGERPLADQTRVRVAIGSAEVLARVHVTEIGAKEATAGARIQLRLESRAVAGRGDRVVLRSYSPISTIGGGRVLDPLPAKRRRSGEAVAVPSADADPMDAAVGLVRAAASHGVDLGTLAARITVPLSTLYSGLARRDEVVVFGGEAGAAVHRSALRDLAEAVKGRLELFHAENPLKSAMPREELRRRVFARAPAGVFERVIEELAGASELRLTADGVGLLRHSVRLTPAEDRARCALLEKVAAARWQGLDRARQVEIAGGDARLADRVARLLQDEGAIARVGDDLLMHTEGLSGLKDEVRRRWPSGSQLDVAAFKELTGLSRKYVIPLLEYLDRERVTRRSGSTRVVIG